MQSKFPRAANIRDNVKVAISVRNNWTIIEASISRSAGLTVKTEGLCTFSFLEVFDDDFSYFLEKVMDYTVNSDDYFRNHYIFRDMAELMDRVLFDILNDPTPYYLMQLYDNRPDKGERAIDFLKRVYARRLRDESITMAKLKQHDSKLWDAVRKWGSRPGNTLAGLIAPGTPVVGRPRLDNEDELAKLDPTKEEDAIALDLAELRKAQREASRRYRASRQSPVQKPKPQHYRRSASLDL